MSMFHFSRDRGRCALTFMITIVLAFPAFSWEVRLSDERFSESGYGLSFRPPADGTLDPQPVDGAVAAWDLGERATVRLKIKRWHFMVEDIEPLVGRMWKESMFGLTIAQPTFVDYEKLKIAERPGLIQYAELQPTPPLYLSPNEKAKFDTRPLYFGQVMIKLDPFSVAMIEMYAPLEDAESAKALLREVTESAELAVPETLYEFRKSGFRAAHAWLVDQDFRALAEERPSDAWYEVRHGGAAIGYARQRWWTALDEVRESKVGLAQPGVVAGRYTLVRRGRTQLVTQHDAYLTDEGSQEIWSKVSLFSATQGSAGGIFEEQRVSSEWAETGVRNGGSITLAFKVPPDADTVRDVLKNERAQAQLGLGNVIDDEVLFSRREAFIDIPNRLPPSVLDGEQPVAPSAVYLSQAALVLLPAALPRDAAGSFAFYAYDSDAGTLAMRTYAVQPTEGGGAVVTERPTPWSPVTTHRFDRRGALVEIVQPGGTTWVPTTKGALGQRFPELR